MPVELALEQRVVAAMKELGFTASDARIYISLLKTHPATGYELAASSGVPRSAIYNVLNRLESRGLVNAVQRKPARYVPLSPDKLMALIESRFNRSLEDLKSSIQGLSRRPTEITTWTIQGYAEMLDQARSMIAASAHSVHLSIWRREADHLVEPLRAARASGVDVVLFSFNPIPDGLGQALSYGIPEEKLEPYWPHKLILVCDRKRVLVGGAEDSEECQTIVSEENALVEMAVSNLVLDITLLGQRRAIETKNVIEGLTCYLAPVEELVNGAGAAV